MKIYVMRHGITQWNLQRKLQGITDIPLNDEGVRMARETGEAFQNIRFDACFVSPLTRAYQTAREVLTASKNLSCPLYITPDIQEMNVGTYEGKSNDDPLIKFFLEDPIAMGAFPGGENIHDVMARTQNFLKNLATKNYENVLVVAHGCAIRCMLNFLYADPENFWQDSLKSAEVTIVNVENGKMTLGEQGKIYYKNNNSNYNWK